VLGEHLALWQPLPHGREVTAEAVRLEGLAHGTVECVVSGAHRVVDRPLDGPLDAATDGKPRLDAASREIAGSAQDLSATAAELERLVGRLQLAG